MPMIDTQSRRTHNHTESFVPCSHCGFRSKAKGTLCEACQKFKQRHGYLPPDQTLSLSFERVWQKWGGA